MPTSVRVIRVVNNEYTVEAEVEVEDIGELFDTLTKTAWGRKVAHLLNEMLPEIPEYKAPSSKEEAVIEQERIKENEEKLRNEGRMEVLKQYGNKKLEDIIEETKVKIEKEMRSKYMTFIRREHLKLGGEPKTKPPKVCFLKYWERIEAVKKETGMAAMAKFTKLKRECDACIFKAECMRKSKKKET